MSNALPGTSSATASTNVDVNEGVAGAANQAATLSSEAKTKNQTDAKQRRDDTKKHVVEMRKVLGIDSKVCERDTIEQGVKRIKLLMTRYMGVVSALGERDQELAELRRKLEIMEKELLLYKENYRQTYADLLKVKDMYDAQILS
ncbi:hypothetical protein FA95DRAFT_1607645 [Auriscalpium vulgare]|uniref:Uncharacterized protein n=1 Tax=Auriscalpium vulgare TaxID=40419 RepID=A0ACB8RNP8_9AGAM|nr:hypothetical protein FA95DRAFT_1607645 [Auriscalpium vulgare]